MVLSPLQRTTRPGMTLAVTELFTQCRHIACYIDGGQNRLPFSIVIGQATLSQQPESLALPFEKFLDAQAIARPLAGLIDLTVPLQLFGLRLKNGLPDIVWPWTDHYQTVLQHSSHTRQLQFDQYERPLPNLYAKQLYIAQHRNLIWHDTKSFASWVISHGSRWNLPWSPAWYELVDG